MFSGSSVCFEIGNALIPMNESPESFEYSSNSRD